MSIYIEASKLAAEIAAHYRALQEVVVVESTPGRSTYWLSPDEQAQRTVNDDVILPESADEEQRCFGNFQFVGGLPDDGLLYEIDKLLGVMNVLAEGMSRTTAAKSKALVLRCEGRMKDIFLADEIYAAVAFECLREWQETWERFSSQMAKHGKARLDGRSDRRNKNSDEPLEKPEIHTAKKPRRDWDAICLKATDMCLKNRTLVTKSVRWWAGTLDVKRSALHHSIVWQQILTFRRALASDAPSDVYHDTPPE